MHSDYGKLSVLIPAFNETSRILNTISETRNLLDTWGLPYEIIVVDDGSSDHTYSTVRSVADDVVKVFRNKKKPR